jgi:hypothetical protein
MQHVLDVGNISGGGHVLVAGFLILGDQGLVILNDTGSSLGWIVPFKLVVNIITTISGEIFNLPIMADILANRSAARRTKGSPDSTFAINETSVDVDEGVCDAR